MKTQLKGKAPASRGRSSVVASVRNATIPDQYVDPDRLREALQTLTATKAALLGACDQADLASSQAGTPLRTHSVRSQIELLDNEVRIIESRIAQAAAGEFAQRTGIAAGVGKALSSCRHNELDREFDPSDRYGRFDPRIRSDRNYARGRGRDHGFDREWEFLHRSLRDPRWYRVARRTNQIGPIDPYLLTQFTTKTGSKPSKPPRPSEPLGPPVPRLTVDEALKIVRGLLKDGGFGTDRVTNGELKTLAALFLQLGAPTANAVIAKLTDAELKLIADDMDSSGIGNYDGLSSSEKEAFIANLATKLDAKQFARIAIAFDDPEQFSRVLSRTGDSWAAKLGFLDYVRYLLKLDGERSAPGATYSLSLSAATVLASLEPAQLADAIRRLASNPGFLDLVFRVAVKMTEHTYPEGIESTVSFEPDLLLKINEIALKLPETSEERFSIFVSSIATLKWMRKMTSTQSDLQIKRLLVAATKTLGSDPVGSMRLRKFESSTYVEWLTELIELKEAKPTVDLLTNFKKGSTDPEDLWMLGYVTGLLLRAQHNVEQRLEARIAFLVGIVGALLNALPTMGQVGGAIALEIEEGIRSDLQGGMSEAAVMHKAVTKRMGSNTDLLGKFDLGYLNALGPTIQTKE
jgi:hypothetical protein